MPNIKSAKKRVLVIAAKTERNKSKKSALKTVLKKFDNAIINGDKDEALSLYAHAVKTVDRAAAHGLLHRNNAAHKKSRMTLRLNRLEA